MELGKVVDLFCRLDVGDEMEVRVTTSVQPVTSPHMERGSPECLLSILVKTLEGFKTSRVGVKKGSCRSPIYAKAPTIAIKTPPAATERQASSLLLPLKTS